MKICIFDPSLWDRQGNPSRNLGDLIIAEAVNREINSLFPDAQIQRIHTHTPVTREELDSAQACSLIFVGGSNILGAGLGQWPLVGLQKLQLARLIVFGVGWHRYENDKKLLRYIRHRFLLNGMLSKRFHHSVRDEFSRQELHSIGVDKVLNTNCPTMWPLLNMNCIEEIPREKSKNVLFMLTDYKKNPQLDQQIINLISKNYENIYFFPQGSGDLRYFKQFNLSCHIIDRSLEAFNDFLKSGIEFDYIGTRLHGGIKCLLNKKRSLILEVDNRAKEIALDTGIPSCCRSDIEYINHWINSHSITQIKLNSGAINEWKTQFSSFGKSNDDHTKEKRIQRLISYQASSFLTRTRLQK
jgi:polysaccharide pyruvyl transferase WcaK-like protein